MEANEEERLKIVKIDKIRMERKKRGGNSLYIITQSNIGNEVKKK